LFFRQKAGKLLKKIIQLSQGLTVLEKKCSELDKGNNWVTGGPRNFFARFLRLT
jgi:hypothetical protein